MNTRLEYTDCGRDIVKADAGGRVLDVGAMVNPLFSNTDTVDINQPCTYQGNINFPDVWNEIKKDVKRNGKYDYSICSHTLEDISNPLYVMGQLPLVSKRGGIVVPSKFIESGRHSGYYRGFIHHRWIWNIEGGIFVGYPKLNLFEHDKFNALSSVVGMSEIVLLWDGEIDFNVVNGDFLGPDNASVEGYYEKLLQD